MKKHIKNFAFTMSEILISLAIIGVVAAITLPSLTGNINEKVWNTQRKALYARMSQAISLMPALNGYGIGATIEDTAQNATQAFITQGLSKVLKINNVCDAAHLSDCGIPNQVTPFIASDKKNMPTNILELNVTLTRTVGSEEEAYNRSMLINTDAVAFETKNGEHILAFYNPYCRPFQVVYTHLNSYFTQYNMCANFIYDLNGKKGPNTVGKDIGFMSALYPTDSLVVSVMPSYTVMGESWYTQFNICNKYPNSRPMTKEEAAVIFYNKNLIGNIYSYLWTSSIFNANRAYMLAVSYGFMGDFLKTETQGTFCIKR